MPVTLNCTVCDDEYEVKPGRADESNYCSLKCSGIGKRKREIRECEQCGAEFRERGGDSANRFCSKDCFYDSMRDQVELTCETCGAKYTRKRSDAEGSKYCSKECYRTRVTLSCIHCGDEFEVKKFRSDSAKYCSQECMGEHRSQKIEIECEVCGGTFTRPPSMADRRFCSRECFSKKVEIECEQCGDTFEVIRAREDDARFCTPECSQNAFQGEGHPRWSGGERSDEYYGPSWHRQRPRALERDGYECVMCGLDRDGHYELAGTDLHVHHKTPFRFYGVENHEAANRLENLITLCRSCHNQVEPISRKRIGSMEVAD